MKFDPSEQVESTGDRFSNWYGMDTENDQEGNVTLACLIHEGGNRWIWKHAGEIVKWCEKQKDRPVVICHNLEYDLVNEFGAKYSDMNLNYLKGRLISARYGNVTFWDSFNHFRMALAAIGETLGIKKLKMDIYSEEYVAMDAWICLRVMTQARDYIASLGGRIGTTSGSSAMSVWRSMTADEFLFGPIDSKWHRSGYYGGRVEIFRAEATGDIRGYDINSMYPYVMLNEFPETEYDDPTISKSKGLAEVTISIPHDSYVAPLVYRDGVSRLLYPVGVIRGTWTYDEIRFAEEKGCKVIEVHRAQGSSSLCRPFDSYINTLYAKRKASTSESERLFLKVLMNSLYGKTVSRNTVTRTVSRQNLIVSGSKRLADVTWITPHRGLLDYNTPPQPYVNLTWGAMITAFSRILLTQYLCEADPKALIYTDTDSIYVLDRDLPESKEIGGMKLERTAKHMKVVQRKAYCLDDQYKAKGVPRARFDDEGNMLLDPARDYVEDGLTSFQAPIRFRQSLRLKNNKPNQWVTVTKRRKSGYDSKILGSDGRYYPPVIGMQGELFPTTTRKARKVVRQSTS